MHPELWEISDNIFYAEEVMKEMLLILPVDVWRHLSCVASSFFVNFSMDLSNLAMIMLILLAKQDIPVIL